MPGIKITKFGGMAPRQMRNINQAMAQVAEDVDLSRGTLRPWRTDKKISDKTGNYLFVDRCCYITSNNCKASVSRIDTNCGYIVATGIKDYPVIQKREAACAGNWNRLGFPIDLNSPNAERINTLPNNFNEESRQYYYTLVDTFGFESAPSLPSDPMLFNNDEPVVISNLPVSFDTYNISKLRIYCATTQLDYGDGVKNEDKIDAYFLLVEEVVFGTSTYIHQPHTTYGEECLTEEYEPPHNCMSDIQYCGNGQLGGVVCNEVWLSEPKQPQAWPEAYRYGEFSGNIIRFLCGENAGYILTDEFPAVIEMESPCQSKGCRSISVIEEQLPLISYQSACMYNGHCFYASKDGLVMLSGGDARIVTNDLYTQDQWQALAPWNMIGIVHDGYYFGFTELASIRFKVPDAIHEQTTIDTLTTLSIKPTAVYRSNQDDLYFTVEDGVYHWNAGLDWKEFTWRGRLNTLPGYTTMTAYKLVQDYSPSHVKHIAYKNHRDEMVDDTVILGDKKVIDSRPHRLKAGYSTLEFDVEIKSNGEIYEYHISTSVAELGAE